MTRPFFGSVGEPLDARFVKSVVGNILGHPKARAFSNL
jgi:hypothetical protein